MHVGQLRVANPGISDGGLITMIPTTVGGTDGHKRLW